MGRYDREKSGVELGHQIERRGGIFLVGANTEPQPGVLPEGFQPRC